MAVRNPQKMPDSRSLFERLHIQLAEIIEKTPPGERLMSEPELAESLNVSRATLREAMRSFEGQGLIRRRQGVGTFVMDHNRNIATGLEKLESIETQANRLGMTVKMGYLGIHKEKASLELAKTMEIDLGDPVVRISRVIWVEEHPAAYLIDILLEGILSEEDLSNGFTGSVLDLIIKRESPKLYHSKTYISATPAESNLAKKLQLQRGDCLQKLEAYLYDDHERMIDYSESYFVPGFFKFHVNREIG